MGWPRAKSANEDGFTIIEVMVALSLMAVAMVAISGVFFTGLKAASAINTRSAGVALATRETEAIRAVPYDAMGFYDSQAGRVASFETLPTISLGPTVPALVTPRLAPAGTATIGPVTYAIRRELLWVGAKGPSAATYPEAYKKTVVVVTWTDGSGPHSVRQDSIVYPGGRGLYAGAGSGATTTTTTPATLAPGPANMVSVTPATAPLGETQLDLVWSAPTTGGAVTHYIVQQATNSSFSAGLVASPAQPAGATTYQASGLSAGTNYHFRILAYSSAVLYSQSTSQNGTTLASTAPSTCAATGITLAGSGTGANQGLSTKTYLKKNTEWLLEPLELVVTYSGTCPGNFTVSAVGPGGFAGLGSPYTLTAGVGSTFRATIPTSNNAWPAVGDNTFTVLQAGAPVFPAIAKSFLFCSATTSPSSDENRCI